MTTKRRAISLKRAEEEIRSKHRSLKYQDTPGFIIRCSVESSAQTYAEMNGEPDNWESYIPEDVAADFGNYEIVNGLYFEVADD